VNVKKIKDRQNKWPRRGGGLELAEILSPTTNWHNVGQHILLPTKYYVNVHGTLGVKLVVLLFVTVRT